MSDGKDGNTVSISANFAVPLFALLSFEEVRFIMEISDDRIAVLGIIVSAGGAVQSVNELLHEFSEHIVGRMGLPLRDRGVNAITIVLDAPVNAVNALTGKLGKLDGVTAKALFQK